MTTTWNLQNKCGIIDHKNGSYSGVNGSQTGTVDKLKALYDRSGSQKTFVEWLNDLKKSQNKSNTPVLDWLQSDSAKDALLRAQKLIDTVQGKGGDGSEPNKAEDSPASPTKVTIAGFHPVTFAIGSILILVGTYFGGRYVINKFSNS